MILNRQRAVRVALRPLELLEKRVCHALGLCNADVTICLVSDAEIARMNETFRKKKGPTDVLSFPAIERKRPAGLTAKLIQRRRALKQRVRRNVSNFSAYIGDIAISPATARRNAKHERRSLDAELRVLILHGILHLLGYDHERDQGQMNRIESRLRRRLGLA